MWTKTGKKWYDLVRILVFQSTKELNIMKKNEIEGYRADDKYQKSNFLIQARYQSTLLEERMLAVALSQLQHSRIKKNEDYKVSFTPGELKKILGSTSNSLYTDAKKAVKRLKDRQLYMEDPDNRQFVFMNLVTMATYDDGNLEIYFNGHLKPFLKDLTSSYAVLKLSVMTQFKRIYSFRLYELLKSMAYTRSGDSNPSKKYIIEFGLNELRFTLGVCNAEEPKVKMYMNSLDGEQPDYDYAFSLVTEKKYCEWRDFRRKILDKAIEEINSTPSTGMYVEMTRITASKVGAATKGVRFIVEYSDKTDNTVQAKKSLNTIIDVNDNFLDDISELIKEPLKIKDLRAIAEAADYDMDKVEKAYRIAEKNGAENLTGFMISAIKNDYEEPVKKRRTSRNTFNDFPQREYNFDEIEDDLIEN